MSDKKRKHASQDEERPSKKQQTAAVITVKHLPSAGIAKPIIASSPGVILPSKINFQSYSKRAPHGSPKLLIHSSEHTTIDFIAREGDSAAENQLKHYLAVFHHDTGELEVTEAKHLTIRSSVRVPRLAEATTTPSANYSSRTALTDAFGTKKSKKAAQSNKENRLLDQGDEDLDKSISAAILANVADDDPDALASEAAARSNKPLPPANLDTDEITEVYAYNTLIQPAPSSSTLESMPIGPWIARIAAKKEVLTRSRFVANRVGYLTKKLLSSADASDPQLTQYLQVLRYIELLIQIHNYIRTLPRKRRIPWADEWPSEALSEGTPKYLVDPIITHIFPGEKTPTTQAMTLLRTTILALTLHIPPPSFKTDKNTLITDTTDTSLDMAIESSEMRKLFRELGCKVEPAKESELTLWGLEKISNKKKRDEDGNLITVKGKKADFAKLTLPLVFPKVGRGKAPSRR